MKAASRYSVAARADLLDIWLHIADDNVSAADAQLDRLAAAANRLRDFPEIGHKRDDVRSGLRVLLQDRYLIIYHHDEAEALVTIERIVHGSRNLAALFHA